MYNYRARRNGTHPFHSLSSFMLRKKLPRLYTRARLVRDISRQTVVGGTEGSCDVKDEL
jgi:hypothetical protein